MTWRESGGRGRGRGCQITTPGTSGKALTYFIEQEDVPRSHQTHDELNASSLAIGDLVHMPVQVDIENLKEPVASPLVPVPPDRVQEIGHDDIGANDGVGRPFCSQEGHTLDENRGFLLEKITRHRMRVVPHYVLLVIGGKRRDRGSRPSRP